MNISIQCRCSWAGHECASGSSDQPQPAPATLPPRGKDVQPSNTWRFPMEPGLQRFRVDPALSLRGPVLRVGKVWYLSPGEGTFDRATLRLYANGFTVVRKQKDKAANHVETSVAWSPFTNVQACLLHSAKADEAFPWLRLFKVSIFHFCDTHYFAARNARQPSIETEAARALLVETLGKDESCSPELKSHETLNEDADLERMRWVVDISRALRAFTCSLFHAFHFAVEPIPDRDVTSRRLLAGYVLLCLQAEVDLVYLELHAQSDGVVPLVVYEDDTCSTEVLRIPMMLESLVTERAGVDCSCFSVEGYNFAARSVAEKRLWLRVISNIKVKVRHSKEDPSTLDINIYRASILEYSKNLNSEIPHDRSGAPLLPLCRFHESLSTQTSSPEKSEEAFISKCRVHDSPGPQPSSPEKPDEPTANDLNMPDVAEEDEVLEQHLFGLPLEELANSYGANGMLEKPSGWVSLGESISREEPKAREVEPLAEPEPARSPLVALPSQSRSSCGKTPSMLVFAGHRS